LPALVFAAQSPYSAGKTPQKQPERYATLNHGKDYKTY
jgi:hypothetical protein